MREPGRLLGIDHGLARIGVAVCDATRLVARELVIIRRKSKREDFEKLNRIAAEQQVVAIVVGLPHNPERDDDEQEQAAMVRKWAQTYAATTPLPIVFWDEQLTSHDAAALARSRRRGARQPIDDLAARVMLQSYIDALRDGLAAPPPPYPPPDNADATAATEEKRTPDGQTDPLS